MKKLRCQFYAIEKYREPEALIDIFKRLKGLSFQDRTKDCNHSKIRVDDINFEEINGSPCCLFSFSRLRDDNWPGVTSIDESSRDLELGDDELLSEETYGIYDVDHNRMVIQYNHIGTRASQIQQFIQQVTSPNSGTYHLIPIFSGDAIKKYQNSEIVTYLDVMLTDISNLDIAQFEGTSLTEVIKSSLNIGSRKLQLTFSANARLKKDKLKKSWTDKVINAIQRRGENDKVVVKIKDDIDSNVEILNLLEHRKEIVFNASSIEKTNGKRYNKNSMYLILKDALKKWDNEKN